ncbi:hypothetical protein ACFVGN_18645 [Streptomyces sp. NPDC057757]|uniref:hypothetical protein n=1 Tax=Streptomyces sp. NPDC057757 TaxID=3346241 RepID=UPI00369E9A43
MKITVRHEADRTFDSLVPRLEAIAAATAPLVDAVTGLALPDDVVIRTMTVDNWVRAHQKRFGQQLHEEVQQLGVPRRSTLLPQIKRKAAITGMRTLWPLMMGQAVDFTAEHPEVVILPEALKHAGELDNAPLLHKLVAHETTHLAQYAASDGEVWAMQETAFPKRWGTADRAYGALMEGHAYWADREITTKIFGEPVATGEISPLASEQYRKLIARPAIKRVNGAFLQGTAEVTQIIDELGLYAFNCVWTRPDLVPLKPEIGNPGLWPRRFAISY